MHSPQPGPQLGSAAMRRLQFMLENEDVTVSIMLATLCMFDVVIVWLLVAK